MLTLDKMEIQGFKSFYGRTLFEFRPGITAVVGPNGCGKSNIGDAISWVLGDQSPKSLRADRMADVIFNGSENRKAMGMAEVSLHFRRSNGHGSEVPEPGEVVVTRRLFRDGESEYRLDGSRCRLRDIQDMLAASQVGSRLYSVIEQGKVDLLLTSKPKDRRTLFEEAAGILGYKNKRRVAEGKLEATQANLIRIHDILAEVMKQTSSLQRQVARARRYRRLQETIRSRRGVLLQSRLAEMDLQSEVASRQMAEAGTREAEASADLARREARVEELRRRFEEAETAVRRDRERLNEVDRSLDRDRLLQEQSREQQAEARREIERWKQEAGAIALRLAEREADLEGRRRGLDEGHEKLRGLDASLVARESEQRARGEAVESAHGESESARSALLAALDRLSDVRSRAERIEQDLRRLAARASELNAELGAAGGERDRLRVEGEEIAILAATKAEELERARREREDAEGKLAASLAGLQEIFNDRETLAGSVAQMDERLRSIEEAERGSGNGGRGLEAILQGAREGRLRLRGRAADGVEVDGSLVAAVEAALREVLSAVSVDEARDALDGVRYLRESGRGRCGFLLPGGGAAREVPSDLAADPGYAGRLAERVRVTGPAGESLRGALEGTLLVRDLEAGLDLRSRHPEWSYVTPDGDLVLASGLVQGGNGGGEEKGILSRRRLREEIGRRLESARAEQERLDRERESREASRRSLAEHIASLEERQREKDREATEARLRLAQRQEELERAERTLRVAEEERERLSGEAGSLAAEREQLREALAAAEEHRRTLEARIAAASTVLTARREEMTASAESLGAFRSEVAAERRKILSAEEEIAAWRRALEEERARQERAAGEERTATELVASLEQILEGLAAGMARSQEERGGLAARLEKGEAEVAGMKTDLLAAEQAEKAARGLLEEARQKLSEVGLEVARLEVERRHLESACREEMNLSLTELKALPPPEGEVSADQIDREIAELKARLERLGAVNLAALEQYTEMEQRQEFLTRQKKDLEDSIASLQETIRKINRTSREKFLEAFEQIQRTFAACFTTLFGGGRAELRLMEEEDVLECGIDIIASPPGKRLQNISLLSGGEKAMTAVALLFALFRYRPSPFCVLDEVDAPLDEANVGRFTRMLRELTPETQFILITHNRRSMEAADLLYGITMEEPGISKVVSMRLDH